MLSLFSLFFVLVSVKSLWSCLCFISVLPKNSLVSCSVVSFFDLGCEFSILLMHFEFLSVRYSFMSAFSHR